MGGLAAHAIDIPPHDRNDMLAISNDQLARIARSEPDTIGHLLSALIDAQPHGSPLDTPAPEGWAWGRPGPRAAARHHGIPMQGYHSFDGAVIYTVVEDDDATTMCAEGDGWAIEAHGRHAGWGDMPEGRAARDDDATDDEQTDSFDGRIFALHDHEVDGDQPPLPIDIHGRRYVPWTSEAFDWDAHIAAQPDHTLSRLTILARGLDLTWSPYVVVPNNPKERTTSPMGRLLAAIEGRLSLKPGRARRDKPFGERLRAAEKAFAERKPG